MDFLSEIEGRQGEELATCVLRWLLLRAGSFREHVMGCISAESRLGPIRASAQFAAFLEYPTTDEAGTHGRADLVVETERWVLGIESKFFAPFQDRQPGKYLETLKKRAAGLAALRSAGYEHAVVVVAPRSRLAEVRAHCGTDARFIVVAWEALLITEKLDRLDLDSAARVALGFLSRFIAERVSFLPSFAAWVPHLRNRWEPRGTDVQREVVRKVWEFFPEPGARMGTGATWSGYYFGGPLPGPRGWFGFISFPSAGGPAPRVAEFVIATNFVFAAPASFRPVGLSTGFVERGVVPHGWIVDFDESWVDVMKWTEALDPLYEALERVSVQPSMEITA